LRGISEKIDNIRWPGDVKNIKMTEVYYYYDVCAGEVDEQTVIK
jgi:hypothetical protein